MSAAPLPDPYAAYGGSVAQGIGSDPYASYGGKATTPTPAKRGLLDSISDDLGLHDIFHPSDNAAATVKDLATHPVRSLVEGLPGVGAIEGAYSGAKRIGGEVIQSGKALVSGKPEEALEHAVYAVPVVGSGIKSAVAARGPTSGSYVDDFNNLITDPDAMGTLIGTAIQAAPLVPESAASLVTKPVQGGARMMADLPSKFAPNTVAAVADAPRAISDSFLRRVGGTKVDMPIKGDTVTPGELYDTAKSMGVDLDTAQATDSAVTNVAKKTTVHSPGGASKFEDLQQANLNALHVQADKILDGAAQDAPLRETFGTTAKQKLIEHQQELNADAGAIYKQLDEQYGETKPDASGIRTLAKKIADGEEDYYKAHPQIKSGGDKQALAIVQNLAKSADVTPAKTGFLDSPNSEFAAPQEVDVPHQDSWSDLHKLRSDLMDITRGKDLVGTRATGWIKQLTGAVDDALTNSKDLPPAATSEFRRANDIYSLMKSTYDDPQSKLYHVVRAPDGLTAANLLANITPDVARQFAHAAPELVPQLQRQTINRILNPAGNDVPDLRNLPARLAKLPKEQLNGVLNPDQVQQLTDMARISKVVHADINPSGTAKVLQSANEFGAIMSGLNYMGEELSNGRPVRALIGGPSRMAAVAIKRPIASALTSPKFTEAVMKASRGSDGWALRGQAKVMDASTKDGSSGLTHSDLDAIRATPAGKKILIDASGRSSGSAAMKRIVAQLAAMKAQSSSDEGR